VPGGALAQDPPPSRSVPGGHRRMRRWRRRRSCWGWAGGPSWCLPPPRRTAI